MNKFIASMLTIAAVGIMAAPVSAGERAGAFSLSPFVGGYTFDGVQHLDSAPVFGLRLGYDLTKNWGVELVGNYLETEPSLGNLSINAVSYRLDILYNFIPDGPLVPYLAVGGGGITLGHTRNGLEINSRTSDATANAGLGIKYFLTDSIALRADARQLFLFENHNSVMYNWEYTAGLTFLFGGRPAAAPVAPPAPTSSLSVTPGSITKGQTATLSWSSQNATDCDIQPNVGPVQPQGNKPITPEVDTAYSLSCTGPGGTASSTANIAVIAPTQSAPRANLSVTPVSIAQGETAQLTWTSQNATDCDIQPKVGAVLPQGNRNIAPSAATAYTLTCSGAGGSASSTANIAVGAPTQPAPVANLSVAPASISQGQTARLTWSSQNAANCAIQPNIGPVQTQGSRDITPSAATAYVLTCSGSGGTIKSSANIGVSAPAPKAEQLCVAINIEFATAKADIHAKYHEEIAKVANFMKEYPEVKGVIEGHTDNKGGKAYNDKLSARRAQNVKSYIVNKFGVDASRLAVKGYGFSKPTADNATAEGRQKNRRIVANFGCVKK